ncbi:MAG: RidA family protein [Chloroflexi bacterium]|jgi:2-iminobutanoate/2-iminopropanoate deaminase|nr:RidA family protein [Chloroflexota bacterium]MBT7081259.1 RidA family protein [Chloroflexota bacterium]MBT7288906.1 RidA family protein [Chloroflexota bacterium]
MTKEIITLPDWPDHPFSPAVRAGDYIFLSGSVGTKDDNGKQLTTVPEQTAQCFENIKKTLAAAGASLDDLVKLTVFLCDAAEFGNMNTVYRQYMKQPYPARSTVIGGLAMPGMLLEIECVAYKPAR